tara:strand:- start:2932 stop:4131 length:1200 start_codon:yes stop_codon:yes gene_type:complete
MALVDSNTFIEPTSGTSLNTARSQFNNAIRSLLTNFRSSSPPATTNITSAGDNIGEQDGMLFRMANSNVSALFISDSVHKKTSKIGGNFTRVGIGNRVENGIASMMANVAHYEIGELTATVTADSGLAGNARLYLVKSNAGTSADFIDVGIPPTNGSVVNTMIAVGGVTADRLNLAGDVVTSAPANRQNAHLKVGSADGTNTSILLGSANTTSNVSIVKLHGGIAEDAGLSIFDQSSKYAPVSANLLSQSTIQGTDTDVAPLMPAGSVIVWPTGTAPAGWLLCNGAAINRTTYAALFALIGVTYGTGNGSSTFNLPDATDRMVAGAGANNAVASSSSRLRGAHEIVTDSATASVTGGTVDVSVGAKDAGGQTVLNSVTAGGHTHTAKLPLLVMNYIIKT